MRSSLASWHAPRGSSGADRFLGRGEPALLAGVCTTRCLLWVAQLGQARTIGDVCLVSAAGCSLHTL